MNRILSCILCVFMAAVWGCGHNSVEEKKPDPAEQARIKAAQVNKKTILVIDDKNFTNLQLRNFIHHRYRDLQDMSKKNSILSRFYDAFVDHHILLHKADLENISITAPEISDYIENSRIENADKKTKSFLLESARIQKFLYQHCYSQQDVSESEIRDYYVRHRKEFVRNAEVHLYQILVSSKDKAIKLRGLLQNNPALFEELAHQESISPESKNNGYMGTFEKGILPVDMENVVFSLKVNQISPVLESKYGFHIFKVSKHSGRRSLNLNRSREAIQRRLMSAKLRNAYQTMLEHSRESFRIEQFPNNLFFSYIPQQGDSSE